MEIFKLFGSIFVNTDEAEKSMQKTEKSAESVASKLGSGIKTAAKWGAGLVAASTAATTAIFGLATKATETADEIDKMSQKIGISNKAYQEWSYVMGQNGMDVSKLQTGMKTLVTQMDMASSGTKSATENFDKLGISIYDASGGLKDQETILNETMHALADMENGTEKARLATELFGKAGIEMMPMLNQGSGAMDELTQRAHDLGLVMSDEAVSAGVVLGDTMDDVKKSFGMIGTQLGVAVMPLVQKFADKILNIMPVVQKYVGGVVNAIGEFVGAMADSNERMNWFRRTFTSIFGSDMADAIVGTMEGVSSAISSAFTAVGNVIGWVKGFLTDNAATIGDIASGLVTTFGGMFEVIGGLFSGDNDKISQGFSSITSGAGQVVSTLWSVFTQFIADFPQHWNKFWTETLPQAIATLCGCEDWEDLKESWPKDWDEMLAGMQGLWDLFSPYIKKGIATLCGCESWEELKKAWPQNWGEVWGACKEIFKDYKKWLEGEFNKMVEWMTGIYEKMPWLQGLLQGYTSIIGDVDPVEAIKQGVVNKGGHETPGGNAVGGKGGARSASINSASFAYVPTANSVQSVSSTYPQQDIAGEIRNALNNLEMTVKVDIVPDDRGIFKVVQNQAKIYSKSTGQGAFA